MKFKKFVTLTILPLLLLCSCKGKVVEEETIDFHSELQSRYLKDNAENIEDYADGTKELSKPKGYEISFQNDDNQEYTIELHSDIDNRTFTTNEASFTFNNLYLGTSYHYKVSSNNTTIKEDDFKTNYIAPRNLDVEGVTNFRDLGGHITNDGKYTKQGMIYRSARFNENNSEEALITGKGIKTVVDDLHIKAEIDLRMDTTNETGGITESVIHESVQYYNLPMTWEGDLLYVNQEEMVNLFDIISDESNYPFVFHCSIGTDRTGFVAFILNALLDVKLENIYRDYLFSNFGYIGGSRNSSTITNYVRRLYYFNGETLKEQAIDYLLYIGVSQDKIDSFLSIMS